MNVPNIGLVVPSKRLLRFWDPAEKIQIVAQTRVPSVSVAQVARRYDANMPVLD
jgi:transposase-like protein